MKHLKPGFCNTPSASALLAQDIFHTLLHSHSKCRACQVLQLYNGRVSYLTAGVKKKIKCWMKLESCPLSCSISSLGNPTGLHTPGWGRGGGMEELHIPVKWHNTSHQQRVGGGALENNPSFFPLKKKRKKKTFLYTMRRKQESIDHVRVV